MRRILTGIGAFIRRLYETMRKRRAVLLVLSCFVVFITTYLLVLPAFTLEKDEAAKQGGIDIPAAEETVEAEGSEAAEDANDDAVSPDNEPGEEAKSETTEEKADEANDSQPAENKEQASEKKNSDDKEKQSEADTKEGKSSEGILKYEGKDFTVSIEDKKSVLPEEANIKVKEIDKDSSKYSAQYKKLYKEALKAVQNEEGGENIGDLGFAKFYDISLSGNKGEIEPKSALNVKISYESEQRKELKAEEADNVRIIHFAEDKKTGEINPEVLKNKDVEVNTDSKDRLADTTFKAEGFSVYAVVYTKNLKTNVISDSGDTYEVTVSYDESAGIPEGAELKVSEIKDTEKEYKNNIKAANKKLNELNAQEVTNPAQFDISIVADGEEIEPKEGSTVNVEIKLASEAINKTTDGDKKESEEETEKGEIWFNGEALSADDNSEEYIYTVAHIKDNGKAEILEDVETSVDEDDNVVLKFDTESFSDYLFDGNNDHGLGNLPNSIYVGDEIYMWHQADMWVSNIGSVVTETKHPNGQGGNDGSNWKTVTAIAPGTFRIYNRYNENQYKEIRVLPARTGTTPPATIDTVDNNRIGMTLNLFDYDLDNFLNDYFNNYNHGDHPVTHEFLNHGINNNHALKFWGSGIGNNHGSQNQYQEHGVTSIVKNTLDTGAAGGYPVLSTDNTSLSYLFTPSDGTDKKAYTNVNHLFKKEGDYYVYDSNQNYAYYDPSQGNGGNFVVYNSTYNQKSGGETGSIQNKAIGFFPFHKWDKDYDLYVNWNKKLNHHFGMSMSVPFSLPKDPKAVTDSEGNPIVFEFSGDDDLWVFIDGKLAMDIGGIHQPTSGTINFKDQKVTVNGQAQSFDFSKLYDGKQHTLQVFYIERGGCDSNCMIKFNLTQYGDVHFDKIDKDHPSDKLKGAIFGIYKDEACTQPLMENLKNGTSRAYMAESNANGLVKFQDIPIGTYYLKELHAPDGYPLDPTVHTVDVYLTPNNDVEVKVTIDGIGVKEPGVKITNKKPDPITVGLKKEWKDNAGNNITPPSDASATFEIKRMRTYQTYTEYPAEGHGYDSAHLTVGWIHNGETHVYKEFDLIAESHVDVTWGYVDGYTGSKDCVLNGQRIDNSGVSGNVVSEGFNMPGANGNATFYIIDDSDNGEAIRNINVAGRQFYGNSGGGVVHSFETISEPDPDFTYTGDNVTNNQVTLPISSSTWQYNFTNLPTFGRGKVTVGDKEQDVAFNYSYYLEEVSSSSPAGTTVTYKDSKGRVISKPTDAEMHESGDITVTNTVPFGYLKITKEVTYNGETPTTAAQKSKLAGEYKFKIYTKEQCGDGDAVQDPNAPAGAVDKDLIITITIGSDGQAVSSDAIKLIAGDYWIKEVESSNPAMFPVNNPIAAKVTKDNTSDNPVIKSLTNNYDENNGPDKISIDIEKKFVGLDNKSQVPTRFKVLLEYYVDGQRREVTLENKMATGTNGEAIKWTESEDGYTWHWHVSNIPTEATGFKIKEVNYDKATGYDWKSATLNGTSITSTVDAWHNLAITAPAATLNDVTNARRTSDSGSNTAFYLEDDDILLTKLTANQGTLVISKHRLNIVERDAVEKGWPQEGGFKTPPHYFSIDEHPNGFSYGNKTITFIEKDGKTVVKFTQNASAQETVFAVTYSSDEARNNANLVNTYEEVPVSVDIIKVNEDGTKKLAGAVFTIRQLEDKKPTENGTVETKSGTAPRDSDPTDDQGKTSFGGLTHGYYEITEKSAPAGYVISEDTAIYFKIVNGKVKWLEKGTDKPSTWEEKTSDDVVSFQAKTETANAAFTVKNEPGAELPKAGGIGTTIFYILGAILVIGSGILLVSRRRMAE